MIQEKKKRMKIIIIFFMGKLSLFMAKKIKGKITIYTVLWFWPYHNLIYKQLATKIKPLNTTTFCFSFIILVKYTVS